MTEGWRVLRRDGTISKASLRFAQSSLPEVWEVWKDEARSLLCGTANGEGPLSHGQESKWSRRRESNPHGE
jgi:hypothetical protein